MLTTEELQTQLANLPLAEREHLLVVIEQSIAADQSDMTPDIEQQHLAICNERLARFRESGTQGIPSDVAMKQVFGDA